MSDSRKYYYLKLKDNFFDTDSMIVLESMPDGYLYSNILLKLYLRSLKNEGRLMFNDRIPYNSTILAQITRQSVGVVEKALQIYKELDLIEVLDNGAIYMLDIQNFIGESSTEADRIRKYRGKIYSEKNESVQMYNKSTPELELEIELDKDIDIDKEIKLKKENINKFFETVWKQYPRKRGKSAVSFTKKKELYKYGLDAITKAINAYKDETKDKEEQFILNGSTFFNGRYKDFIVSVDAEKEVEKEQQETEEEDY